MANSKMERRLSGAVRNMTASALLATSGLVAMAPGALAQEAAQTRTYDIPAGALGPALNRFAAESGLRLAYDSALVEGRRTRGLRGAYGANEGLSALLNGSGLTFRNTGAGAVTLTHALASPTPSAAARSIPAQDSEVIVVVGQATRATVTQETLDFQQAHDLADIFRSTPSVSVGGSIGIAQKVYIRGVEDTLLNITVDGAPQTGTLFHHIGRVSVEPELLRRVDVLAGAGEATAGFGAIGGAVRFRTRDAGDLLSEDQRFGAMARLGYFSNEGYRTSLTGYGQLNDNWNALASIVYVDREDSEDGAGNRLRGSGAEQALGFVKVSGQLSADQNLTLSYERREEEGELGQRPNWPALATDPLYAVEAERNTFVANYRFAPNPILNLEATAYWTRQSFIQNIDDRWGPYEGEIATIGVDVRNTSEIGAHSLTYGVEYRSDEVSSRYLDEVLGAAWAWDPAVLSFREEGNVFGAYIQDHFQVSEPLLLSFGARYDSYDMEQITYDNGTESDGVSVNIGATYDISPSLRLIAGYAEAMRGKEVGDAFTLEHRPGRIALEPGLQPEEVTNQELGVRYDDGAWRASATYYVMEINDVILDQLGAGAPPQAAVYYQNVGTFETEGYELALGLTWQGLNADLFFTSYDALLNGHTVEGYEEIGLANASGDRLALRMDYEISDRWRVGWNATHVADLNDIDVLYRAVEIGWIGSLQQVDKPGYTVHDIYAQWRPLGDESFTLGLAVQNLFDEHYRDHASVADYSHIPDWENVMGVYEPGRDIRVSAGFRF